MLNNFVFKIFNEMKVKTVLTEGKKLDPVVLLCKNMHLDFEDFSVPFQLV